MARVFNISFPYGDVIYNALLTIKGGDEHSGISLQVEKEQIQLFLPHGKLTFPIREVVNYFATLNKQYSGDMVMHITDSISLHLLNRN